MPIYEYECPKCGERFELRSSMSDSDNEIKCPKCGTKRPKRILSLFGTNPSGKNCAPRGYG